MVKFKGHVNENLQMIPSYEAKHGLIAVGSEDGSVFIYDRKELNENLTQKMLQGGGTNTLDGGGGLSPSSPGIVTKGGLNPYARQKNRSCESFVPFPSKDVNRREKAETITNIALFAPERTVQIARKIHAKVMDQYLKSPARNFKELNI